MRPPVGFSSRSLAWAVLLSAFLALTIGGLDALLNIVWSMPSPWTVDYVDVRAGVFTFIVGLVFAASLGSFLILLGVSRLADWNFESLGCRVSSAVLACFVAAGFVRFGPDNLSATLAKSVLFGAVAIALGVLSDRGTTGLMSRARSLRIFGVTVPTLLAGSFLALAGEMRFYAEGGWPALRGASSIGYVIGVVAVCVLVGVAFHRIKETTTAAGLALVLVAMVVLSVTLLLQRGTGREEIVGSPGGRHNILLISIDTLRTDRLSVYNSAAADTENIRRFSDDALVFDNAYSPSPWTLPGVASFTTGLNPIASGVDCRTCQLSDSVYTLAERLQDAGYSTAAFGDNPNVSARNLLQGFREHRFRPTSPGQSPGAHAASALAPNWFERRWTTADITDRAMTWLDQNQDQRFFLWVHYLDPHIPYSAPEEVLDNDPAMKSMVLVGDALGSQLRGGLRFITSDEKSAVSRLYDGEILEVDRNFGRLFDRLRSLGLYDDLVIALVSDHGEELWDHGSFEHGHSLYDELLRVPLLLKAPSKESARIKRRVSTMQLPRTILEAADVPVPESSEADLADSLFDESAGESDRTMLIGALLYYQQEVGIIAGDFKYTRAYEGGEERLFNLADDPTESRQISDERKMDEMRRILAGRLDAVMKQRKLFVDESAPPASLPIDQLRSLGYL